MAAVSFSGLATGLDTGSIVAQLVELKRAPVYRLQARVKGYEAQKKALDTFKTKLLALQTAAQNIDTAGEFSSLKATSSDEDAITVTAGSDAAPGSYNILVTDLATAQKDVSQGYDSKLDSLGSGLMSFTVNGETTDLTLVGYTSLESLAAKINNDVAGVSASIVFDGSETGGYHLVMSSTESGGDAAFSVDMSGMSGGLTPLMTNEAPAADAVFSVDGIEITGSGNNVTDVISGLSFNLLDAGTGLTTLKIETDDEGISENIKALVDSYNDLFGFIETQSGAEGDLRDSPTLRAAASRMQNIFSSSLSGGLGDLSLMSQVGIKRGEGRQLSFDAAKFKEALSNDFGGVRDPCAVPGKDKQVVGKSVQK